MLKMSAAAVQQRKFSRKDICSRKDLRHRYRQVCFLITVCFCLHLATKRFIFYKYYSWKFEMRKILLWSELKNQRVSREAIFSSTESSEYLLTISYTDSKLYFDLKIQSTEHNSSTIISAEYFTSVDIIVRMITVNSVSAVYSIIHRNKRNNSQVIEKFYEKWSRGELYPLFEMMFLSFSDTVKKRNVCFPNRSRTSD